MRNNPKESGRAQAVITIYLSIVLVIVITLIFTAVESARYSYISYRTKSVSYIAEDSVFSKYAQPLFDDYGVMMLWGSEDDILNDFRYYAELNLAPQAMEKLLYTDIGASSLESVSIVGYERPSDRGGLPFAKQVGEYMQYYLGPEALSQITDDITGFDQADKASAFMDKIRKYKDVFRKVEESAGRVNKAVNKAKTLVKDPLSLLEDCEDILKGDGPLGEPDESSFRKKINELKSAGRSLTEDLKDIQQSTGAYYNSVTRAQTAVNALESELEDERPSIDGEVYDAIAEQITDIKQKSADTDFDYYLVGKSSGLASSYIDRLESLDKLFEGTSDKLTKDNLQQYKKLLSEYKKELSDLDLDDLMINYDDTKLEKESSSFLNTIEDLVDSGILGFIAGDLSEKTLDLPELPSSYASLGLRTDNGSLPDAAFQKALFAEYILSHFSDKLHSDNGKVLDYEAEYILAGTSSDRDNLAHVTDSVIAIRTGCNIISLLKSSAKMAETYALAASLTGFTGMPIVIKITQLLIISVWALAESVCDVKALLEGHKIQTVKSDDAWYISISGLKNFGKDSIFPEGTGTGLDYRAYLRALLLLQDTNVQRMRTMDLIEADMRTSENDAFRISQCYTSLTMSAIYRSRQLFTVFPFVNKLLGSEAFGYSFNVTLQYSY